MIGQHFVKVYTADQCPQQKIIWFMRTYSMNMEELRNIASPKIAVLQKSTGKEEMNQPLMDILPSGWQTIRRVAKILQ